MILISDLHIRSSKPRSRIDNFLETQDRKLRFVLSQAMQSPPLLIGGDLLNSPRSSPWLEQYIITLFKEYDVPIYVTPGQHDLLYHSLQNIDSSSIGVLQAAGVINILTKENSPVIWPHDGWAFWGCAFGEEPEIQVDSKRKNLLLFHHMVICGDPLWPGQVADQAGALLRKYKNFDIIATGDNHQTFCQFNTSDSSRRILVNPGSMMRMTSAQAQHQPRIFKWEEESGLEEIFIPIAPAEEVLDLTHIEEEWGRDERIGAFVERLHNGYELGLDFVKNLSAYLETNQVEPMVQEIIWEAVGE